MAAKNRDGHNVKVSHLENLVDGSAGGVESDSITMEHEAEVIDELIDCSEEQIAEGLRQIA